MEETQKQSGWRWGVNRWIILGLILISIPLFEAVPPLRPHIQLPAENIIADPLFTIPFLGPIYLSNTLVATILADIILLFITFFVVQRAVNTGSLIPTGLSGAIEGFLEILYNLTESTAGKWTKAIFPWFAAITMLVLVVNWMELVPGVDSIGALDKHHIPHPEECTFTPILGESVVAVNSLPEFKNQECASGVVPFVRVASTDLNFTIALAIISLTMTQVIGVRALGASYFTKFINVKTIFTVPAFGLIDFLVGIFETVSEFSKIISFSFRLFGKERKHRRMAQVNILIFLVIHRFWIIYILKFIYIQQDSTV